MRSSRELGRQEAVAASLGQLGRLAQFQGRPAAALSSFAEALKVLRELDDRRGLAEFTLAAAEVELELGLVSAAGEHLRQAAALLTAGDNREQQSELARLQGEWHLLRGEPGAAREALQRAVQYAGESRGIVALLDARLSAAEEALESGPAKPALAELVRLHTRAEALGHARLRLRADELLARAALATGDLERAQATARAGLERAEACGGYSGAYRLHLLLARALERSGRRPEAAAERGRAADEIARLSRDLAPEQRKTFHGIAEEWEVADRIEARTAAGKG